MPHRIIARTSVPIITIAKFVQHSGLVFFPTCTQSDKSIGIPEQWLCCFHHEFHHKAHKSSSLQRMAALQIRSAWTSTASICHPQTPMLRLAVILVTLALEELSSEPGILHHATTINGILTKNSPSLTIRAVSPKITDVSEISDLSSLILQSPLKCFMTCSPSCIAVTVPECNSSY